MREENSNIINELQEKAIPSLGLKEQVALDLRSHLKQFRSESIGLRKLSEKSGIHQRTLKRLLAQENRPGYQTLVRLYTCLIDSPNGGLLLKNLPEKVASEIQKKSPVSTTGNLEYSEEANKEMFYDKVFAEIYCLASMSPITNEYIQYRYGMSGAETADRMLDLGVLKLTKTNMYTTGDKQIEFSPKLVKRLGLNLVEKYVKTQDVDLAEKNLIAFYAEGLSPEGYRAWLKIDQEAFYKKIEVTKKEGMLGDIKTFTFMATDTMRKE